VKPNGKARDVLLGTSKKGYRGWKEGEKFVRSRRRSERKKRAVEIHLTDVGDQERGLQKKLHKGAANCRTVFRRSDPHGV